MDAALPAILFTSAKSNLHIALLGVLFIYTPLTDPLTTLGTSKHWVSLSIVSVEVNRESEPIIL